MIIKCQICGKELNIPLSRIKRGCGKFCSIKCMLLWWKIPGNHPNYKGGKVKQKCQICDNEFSVTPSVIKNGGGKFCSTKCHGLWKHKNIRMEKCSRWRGGGIKRICKVCGKNFIIAKCRVKNGGGIVCSHKCLGIWSCLHQKNKNTGIEIKLENELQKRNIKYLKQISFPIARTVVDFLIPSINVVIYADGDYWHGLLGRKEKDKQQDFMLIFHGYKVYRFREKEINKSVSKCVDMIRELR